MNTICFKCIKTLPVLLLTILLFGCGKPKDLRFGLAHNVTVKSVTTAGISVQATLPIENPNGYRINAKDADFTLTADNREIARIKQDDPLVLPGNSKAEYTVNATISINSGSILSVMSLFNNNANLNIDGTINVSSFLVHRNVLVHQEGVQNYLKPIMGQMKLF